MKDMSFVFTIRRTEKDIERTERHIILIYNSYDRKGH